jgi:DivIVA domain-containing protein
MATSPLQIRAKQFKKVTFGGFKKDEVQHYLQQLGEEYAQIKLNNEQLEDKIMQSSRQIEEYKNIENTLLKSLSQAQEANKLTIEQGQKEADVLLLEAKMRADALLKDAEFKAKQMVQDAKELSDRALHQMNQELSILMGQYKTVEHHKITLVDEVKNFLHETLDKINELTLQPRVVSFENELQQAKEIIEENKQHLRREMEAKQHYYFDNSQSGTKVAPTQVQQKIIPKPQVKPKDSPNNPLDSAMNFFDEL